MNSPSKLIISTYLTSGETGASEYYFDECIQRLQAYLETQINSISINGGGKHRIQNVMKFQELYQYLILS